MNPIDMLTVHPFWGLLTLAVLVWYSTVTIYVAVRGAYDIKNMLSTLSARDQGPGKDSQEDVGKSGK
jgi:hypothetical protein